MNGTGTQPLPAGEPGGLASASLLCTTRAGGTSKGAYASNNLGLHVYDDPEVVASNRLQLLDNFGLNSIQWLNQVHGTRVLPIEQVVNDAPTADALFTQRRGIGLAILTADCLPVILVDTRGELVAAAHAGWRGLCAGILQELVAAPPIEPSRLKGFIGPAIGTDAFEVGPEVVSALNNYGLDQPGVTRAAPPRSPLGVESASVAKYYVDLALAARLDLLRLGVSEVTGGHWCTVSDTQFYSWRRETRRAVAAGDEPATGRQATLVWLPD